MAEPWKPKCFNQLKKSLDQLNKSDERKKRAQKNSQKWDKSKKPFDENKKKGNETKGKSNKSKERISETGLKSQKGRAVQITNLPYNTTKEDIDGLVSQFGPYKKVSIVTNGHTNECKAYVHLPFHLAAKAIADLDGYKYNNLILHADWSEPPERKFRESKYDLMCNIVSHKKNNKSLLMSDFCIRV